MRIEWIEVENFKGFDKRRFEFDEHFTLIVGENGSGKSTAICICGEILRAWVNPVMKRGFTPDLEPKYLRIDSTVLKSGKVSAYILPLRISASLTLLDFKLEISGSVDGQKSMSALQGGLQGLLEPLDSSKVGLAGIARHVDSDGLTFSEILPVCACYSPGVSYGQERASWEEIMAGRHFRKDGYEAWDNAQNPSGKLAEWLGRQEAISREDNHEVPACASVKAAIASAIPGCRKVWFSAREGELMVELESGFLIGYSRLSDGQRQILTIAGDIARRAALLNPHLDDPVSETPGVVLIDEIDLHLHPRWQRRIMEDLRRVFPKIQFIATTHSPIIISAAKDAKVIVLEENGSRELAQAYGLDVNWVVEELQGGEARPAEIAALISKAEDLIEECQFDEARQIVDELRHLQRGPSVDSVRLESTIDNLIALAHAED